MNSTACDRARFWVSLHLDGALSEFEGALLERHLRGCAPCRAFAQDTRAETRLLRGADLETPATPVVMPVRRHVAGRGVPLAAGTVAAAAVLGLLLHHPLGSAGPAAGAHGTRPSALALVAPGDANLGVQRLKTRRPHGGPVRGEFIQPA